MNNNINSCLRNDALEIFQQAIADVQPSVLLQKWIRISPTHLYIGAHAIPLAQIGRCKVLAAGKASAAMARQARQILGEVCTDGLIVSKYGHALPVDGMQQIEAAHPVPDTNSVLAASMLVNYLQDLQPHDIVIFLLSGGASALLTDLPEGCTLADVQYTNEMLIKSGATIAEINAVRKHLSAIKGGGVAKLAAPAALYTLVISDVIGDDLSIIGSGPTVADSSTFADVFAILMRFSLWEQLPVPVRLYLQKGVAGALPETPKTGEACFNKSFTFLIGNNSMALSGAATKAQQLGYETVMLQKDISGSTPVVAHQLLATCTSYAGKKPACLLAGGETTLAVTGSGKGGRNMHLVLCALQEMLGRPANTNYLALLCAGTDGSDGPTDAAGAIVDQSLLFNVAELPDKYIEQFDAYHYFERHGGLIKTGPTHTNVMDIVIVLLR
jgi:glycerate 2-kinase